MSICKECGKSIDKSYSEMCQSCYVYFRNGGTVNTLPEHGRVEHDENGKVICHICGRAYVRLGSHVKESHDMSIDEYKEKYGLCRRTKTTEKSYSSMMRIHANNNGMRDRLLKSGQNTRIKKGDTKHRKNKEVRLQEILEKRDRKGK